MKTRLFALSLILLTLSTLSAQAQPTYKTLAPADFKASSADLEQWANHIKKLCPSEEWQVKVEGNDVLIQRPMTVQLILQRGRYPMDEAVEAVPNPPRLTLLYQIRLRFSPLLSLDKYHQLETANALAALEDAKLARKYKVPVFSRAEWGYDLDSWSGKRKKYLKDSEKLVFYWLPHYYCDNYSLTVIENYLFAGRRWNDAVFEEECKRLEVALGSTFFPYKYTAAKELPFYREDELTP